MTQQINLFNPALRKQRELLTARNVGISVAFVLIGVLTFWLFAGLRADRMELEARSVETQLKNERDRLVALSKQAAELKPDARIAAELAQANQLLASRKEVMGVLQDGALGRTEGFSEHLRAIARQSVEGLWLTGFAISSGGNDMEIRGRTLNPELVPAYLRHLNSEKAFNGRSFAALDMKGVAETTAVHVAASAAKPDGQAKPLPYIEFSLMSTEPAERKP